MSLSALTWQFIGSQSFASASVAAAFDALYTLGTAVTYADGSTRTPGSGNAWTWSRFQVLGVTESVYASPPTGSLAQRVIFAGSTTAKTPTMLTPDTWATNTGLVGIAKNAGAFNAWDNAAPFTSGEFSGYSRCWTTAAGAGTVYAWESAEGVVVSFNGSYLVAAGALIDPHSTDVLDAESDGRRYALFVSGSGAAADSAWQSSAINGTWLRQVANNGAAHGNTFEPGSATMVGCQAMLQQRAAMTSTGLRTKSGAWQRAPIAIRASATAPNDFLIGRLREIFLFADSQTPRSLSVSSVVQGWVVAASATSDSDAMLLQA